MHVVLNTFQWWNETKCHSADSGTAGGKSASEQDRFKEYVTMVIESEFKLTLFQEQKT